MASSAAVESEMSEEKKAATTEGMEEDDDDQACVYAREEVGLLKGLWRDETDFIGQELAYALQFYIIWGGTLFSVLTGLIMGSFFASLMLTCVGGVIAAVVTIPAWPFYRCHPIKWVPPDPNRFAQFEEDQAEKEGEDEEGEQQDDDGDDGDGEGDEDDVDGDGGGMHSTMRRRKQMGSTSFSKGKSGGNGDGAKKSKSGGGGSRQKGRRKGS